MILGSKFASKTFFPFSPIFQASSMSFWETSSTSIIRRHSSLYETVLPLTRGVLAPGGVVCFFGELAHPSYRVTPLYAGVTQSFRHVEMHRATIDSFGGEYGFILASDDVVFREVPPAILRDCADRLRGSLHALVPERFPSAFYLPPYLLKHFRRALSGDSYEPQSPEANPELDLSG